METGLLILGDNLADPHTGQIRDDGERQRHIVELGVAAEGLGFDWVALGEHHLCDYIVSAPPIVLASIAARTRHIRLGTGVTLLGSLDPLRAAEDYASLDAISGGRVEIVAGRGVLKRTYRDFGFEPDESRELFEAHVLRLLELWRGEEVDSSGAVLRPRPVDPARNPLWIGGGSSPTSVDLAAQLGLPLMLPSVLAPPEAFLGLVGRYRERFEGPGRPVVGACSHVHVASSSELARQRWEPYHMNYIRWVAEELVPWGGANLGPRDAQMPSAAPAFEDLAKGPAIAGSPAEVRDRILGMRELLGLDLHLAMMDHGGIPQSLLDESLELFAAEVMPALRTPA